MGEILWGDNNNPLNVIAVVDPLSPMSEQNYRVDTRQKHALLTKDDVGQRPSIGLYEYPFCMQ